MPTLPRQGYKRYILKIIYSILVTMICSPSGFSQKPSLFVAPEVMLGKNVPNYSSFPDHSLRKTYAINIGRYHNDTLQGSDMYFNFPHTGVSLAYSELGNPSELGEEYSITPYITLNLFPKLKHAVMLKLGLGASYFTRTFFDEQNWYNQAISSSFTWNFQGFVYYNFYTSPHFNLKLGGGFWHSSNSHIQLPNFGLNAAMFSFSGNYYFQPVNPERPVNQSYPSKESFGFIQGRTGIGLHVLGGTVGPKKAPKQPVFTQSFDYGRKLNPHLKLYTGLFYRYYSSYFNYLENNSDEPSGELTSEASNINLHFGCEFLMGHLGMNVEGGINLYKPFYKKYYNNFRSGVGDGKYWAMKTFNTRLGLNMYLINTNQNPQYNIALGAHINANLGTADFGELSLTYTKSLR